LFLVIFSLMESIKQMSALVEGMSPGTLNGTAGNSATVGGRRRKLKLVTKKAARKALKKLGMKLRGGGATVADAKTDLPVSDDKGTPASMPAMGGRRKTKKSASRRHRAASMFGL
jgi:hypothetical protein